MNGLLKIQDLEEEVVILSKTEFDEMKNQLSKQEKEIKKLKANIRLGQELQKGLISLADGKGRSWEEVRSELKGKTYE